MPDRQDYLFIRDRHTSPALLPALLFSVAVHAVAGGLLLSGWPHALVEPPRPLTVTVEAVVPPPAMESAPPQVERHQVKNVSNTRPAVEVALPLRQLPAPVPVAEERITTAVPALVPAPGPESAQAIVAKASGTAGSQGRAEAIEPPHFEVAYLNNPRPAYPPVARRLGLEGLVVLRVQVSAGGAPEQVAIARTSGASMLDDAAQKAVQGWTFVPARRGDTPVAHAVEVPIRFQLRN